MAAFLHMICRVERIFLCPPVTNEAASPVPRGSAVPIPWCGNFEVHEQMRDQNKQLFHKVLEQAKGTKQEGQSCWFPACASHCVPHYLREKSETTRRQKKTSVVNIKSPEMFCIKGIRSELSTVLPGSVLSPWCDLCSLHPLWWAWFCCSTSHSTESSVSGSPPAQSQTPAGHQERKKQWLHHNRTPVSE